MTTQTNQPAESEAYSFSARELQRLAAYRAAVVAHFYTDECETASASAPRLIAKNPPLRSTVSR